MDKITCTLTNNELADSVEVELNKLIKTGGKSFTMQVPARVNKDTDLLIAELLTRFRTNEQQALNTGGVRLSLSDAKINEAVEYWIDTDNIRIDSNGKGFGYHYKEGILKAIDLLNET